MTFICGKLKITPKSTSNTVKNFSLLYLYSDPAPKAGIKSLCEDVTNSIFFNTDKYSDGLEKENSSDIVSLFLECIQKCRQLYSVQDRDKLLDKLDKYVDKTTIDIVSTQQRGRYDECAMLIAALGEVYESNDISYNVDMLMQKYKNMFPHHNAFHKSLRKMGMK